jgi:Ca2+-transporting ATPase
MHRKTPAQIFKQLKTREHGLTNTEVKERLKEYGPNQIKATKKKPLIVSFLEEFTDLMVVILIIAALIAGASGEVADAGVILFIVVLNATIGFMQKYKAEKALEALQNMLSPHAKVIRNGKVDQVDASQLVPGDIILIAEGDRIPADARLIQANELQVDESPLTGESVPVQKNIDVIEDKNPHLAESKNIVFMGTSATHGTAKAVVIQTGMHTEFGKIANLTQSTSKDKSPLQKELHKIGVFVGKITLVISGILLISGWLWQGKSFTETFLFAVSVAVAAVPEGLPATITIALAIGVQRLAKKRAIMKKLSSVETLGSTTVICTDKTGTLTKNQMTVVQAYVNGETVEISGSGYTPKGNWSQVTEQKALAKICETALLCNDAKLIQKGRGKKWDIVGDPTEGALLVAAEKTPFNQKKVDKQFKRMGELPFDSTRKMMTTIDRDKTTKKLTAHLKGAPDEVLEICTHYYEGGKLKKLTPAKKKEILKVNHTMAQQALRVLAFAQRELKTGEGIPNGKKGYSRGLTEKNMVFVGLMGMIDPPRPEVFDAVAMAKKAGIRIYMVTGDFGVTAQAIGEKLGIVEGKNIEVITGQKLNKMSEKQLSRILKKKTNQILFARVSPEHKLTIVKALKKNGEIVAMTGDGVNDAPALKRADIGVAMGITGTDVSKEAADMILVDDSFGTIVTAVEEGRTIYNNLKKFVFFIFSCNIGELVTVFTAILLGIPAPLTAILILAVDLGTDVLPAIALGVDPEEPGIMDKPPRSQKEHIMKKPFVIHFVYLGMTIGAIVVAAYFWMLYRYDWQWGMDLSQESLTYLKASTSAFVILVFIQMINAFNSRSLNQSIFKLGLFSNRHLLGAVTISVLTAIAFVELPFFQNFLHTTSLDLTEWLVLAGAAFSIFVIEETRKLISNSLKKEA